ncbi:OLC1v1019455C1 [Oldenlandia corymbosa var. corymbosa]|uniref:OLC1v1019455C1 n=1 Tax=Oldenlandia corymbosa var. corymbosa TaxID=529605 RepID=A0AAV1EEI2_OLDCO|nr:OLC1v1019455C1 [Oldenlandia corymbosa var. corymbosa]
MDEKRKLQVRRSVSDIKIVKRSSSRAKVERFEKPSLGNTPIVVDVPHGTTIEVVIFRDTNWEDIQKMRTIDYVCPILAAGCGSRRMIQTKLMICGLHACKEPESIIVSGDDSYGRVKKYWAIDSGSAVSMEIWKKAYSLNGVIHKSIAYANAYNAICYAASLDGATGGRILSRYVDRYQVQ